MSVHASSEAERARVSHAQREQPMELALRRGELIVGGAFVAAAVALAVSGASIRSFSVATAAL
jgi:hypothetical protein